MKNTLQQCGVFFFMVEIYSIMKNEEKILPLYLEHYKTAFPGCIINVFDNGSTDNSVKLCKEAGCNVGKIAVYNEVHLQDFKNNIWKKSKAEWVIICDIDEILQICQADLDNLADVDVIWFKGYNMLDVDGTGDPRSFHTGYECVPYDKCAMFRRSIRNINYAPGAHSACPEPRPRYSKHKFFLLHYNKRWFTQDNFIRSFPNVSKEAVQNAYRDLTKNKVKIK